MKTADYRLPDGRIVKVDDTAAKGAPVIDFELKAEDAEAPRAPGQWGPRGRIVQAVRVRWMCADCGRETSDGHECPQQRRANRATQRRRAS